MEKYGTLKWRGGMGLPRLYRIYPKNCLTSVTGCRKSRSFSKDASRAARPLPVQSHKQILHASPPLKRGSRFSLFFPKVGNKGSGIDLRSSSAPAFAGMTGN